MCTRMLAFEIFTPLLHESNLKFINSLHSLHTPVSYKGCENLPCLKHSQLSYKSVNHEGFRPDRNVSLWGRQK